MYSPVFNGRILAMDREKNYRQFVTALDFS